MNEFLSQQVVCSESTIVWILQSMHEAPVSRSNCDEVHPSTEGLRDLSELDAVRWERYRAVAKKNQFLMSRRAISFVLQKQFGTGHSLSFVASPSGCPRLLDRTGRDVASVSLSHSQNVVVLGIDLDLRPIGVDCEMVESVVPNAVYRYLGESVSAECADLSMIQQKWRAAVRWTEFEARWKALQNYHMVAHESGNDADALEGTEMGVSDVPKSPGSLLMQGWSVDSNQWSLLVTPLGSKSTNECHSTPAVVCVCIETMPLISSEIKDDQGSLESLIA